MAGFSQASILIVDDEAVNHQLLGTRLRLAGFESLIHANSGAETLEILARQKPDLILLDVMMPGMDGYEVTRRIRSTYPDDFIPIILVSALKEPESRVKGIDCGANDFLSRPYNADELIARINSLLSVKQARDELNAEREKMALLYEISQALSARLDMKSLLEQIVVLTTNLTGASKAILVLVNRDGTFMQKVQARRGELPRSVDTIAPMVLSNGLLGWVIQNRQPVLLPDTREDERWVEIPDDDEQALSAAAVPLLRSGEAIGGLLLTAPEPGRFHAKDVDLLMAIGAQAAISLENSALYEQARLERARVEALLNQTGDPVIVTDAAGWITRFNPAAAKWLKLNDDAIGQPLSAYFSLSLVDLFIRAQEHGKAISGEMSIRDRSGQGGRRTFNISISPVEAVGYILVWQDITALKENERVRLDSERREKQRLVEVFSRYMSPTLVERVIKDPHILKRRERRQAAVMFADLRGFTRLTVEHEPDTVLELLNDIFSEMQRIVYENEGVIFDLSGDELMIAFNVPYDQDDAGRRVLHTAIEMQRCFTGLREKWHSRGMQVGMGIGINCGQVVLGHIGGPERMNYSMVGEAVNIAHRLVEIAEDGQIVISPEVLSAEGLDDDYLSRAGVEVRELPPRTLKGKDTPQPMILIEIAGINAPLRF